MRAGHLIVFLALAGCADPELARLAGPNPPPITPRTVLVTIADPDVIDAVAKGLGQAAGEGRVTRALAENLDGTPCSIVVPPPRGPADRLFLVLLYHELRHCQEGRWHP